MTQIEDRSPQLTALFPAAAPVQAPTEGGRAPFTATNWSEPEDGFSTTFYDQYIAQMWVPDEIPVSNDKLHWASMSDAERTAYTRASAGLNALDTLQGEVGMPSLHALVGGHIRKATLQFQAMMEDIHAKSYSMMNKTFLSTSEEREAFVWVQGQPQLQFKVQTIQGIMEDADRSPMGIWKKMTVSCMLETALFYSGFFYPLYLAGQGKMVASGEVFNLIIRDEALHGVYVSMLANELFEAMSENEQEEARAWFQGVAMTLYVNELRYSEAVYDDIGLSFEVKKFVRYNFNVLCDNLNMPRLFPDEDINPVVRNGIKTTSTTHDFFSVKGNSYAKIAVEALTDVDVREMWDAGDVTVGLFGD